MKAAVRAQASEDDLLDGQFPVIQDLVYQIAGIAMNETKLGLVQARIVRRIRELDIASVREYVALVQRPEGRAELTEMVDRLTTNKTSFFREDSHFAYLQGLLDARGDRGAGMTIWSAGCSSGEEPYTIAMILSEHARAARSRPGRVLATDLSARVLDKARAGEYSAHVADSVPADLRKRYMKESSPGTLGVVSELKSIVRFARLNLMDTWPIDGPFDLIFCRNVMIYFDMPTRTELVGRYRDMLTPGGHLFIGHAESLGTGRQGLTLVQPAVYRKDL